MAAPQQPTVPLELGPEVWGDKMKRAYLHGRRAFGYTYDSLATLMTEVGFPISDQSLLRFEMLPEAPTRDRQLLNAVVYATALGYDPTSLDLPTLAEVGRALNLAYLRMALDPRAGMVKNGGGRIRSRCSGLDRKSLTTPGSALRATLA